MKASAAALLLIVAGGALVASASARQLRQVDGRPAPLMSAALGAWLKGITDVSGAAAETLAGGIGRMHYCWMSAARRGLSARSLVPLHPADQL
jgi:hypothetical protein